MRDEILMQAIRDMLKENKELFDRLGSDYDENGVAYWEKLTDSESKDS